MLTDGFKIIQSGRLNQNIHLPSTAKLELLNFIATELPLWRDHPDRPATCAETTLTEHLCDYLNSATSNSFIWSHIQFRTETGDETRIGRKIDLSVKPRSSIIFIEGRRHTLFDALFPIECKRLPTPKEKDRDEREYVITKSGTTGGIQRFKFGYHGAKHNFAVMIAYVQQQSFKHWLGQINLWIQELADEPNSIWNKTDFLLLLSNNPNTGISTLKSQHLRSGGLNILDLHHLWIKMS